MQTDINLCIQGHISVQTTCPAIMDVAGLFLMCHSDRTKDFYDFHNCLHLVSHMLTMLITILAHFVEKNIVVELIQDIEIFWI